MPRPQNPPNEAQTHGSPCRMAAWDIVIEGRAPSEGLVEALLDRVEHAERPVAGHPWSR